MHRLVWKFWVAAWLALLAMLATTALLMSQWHRFEFYADARTQPQAVLGKLAAELTSRLKQEQPVNDLLERNELSEFATSYLITPQGEDVLGRPLPDEILNSAPTDSSDDATVASQEPSQRPMFAIAVHGGEATPYFLIVSFNKGQHPIWMLFQRLSLPWLLGGSLALAGLLALCLAYLVGHPIQRLATSVADGNLAPAQPGASIALRRDEIGVLARALHDFSVQADSALAHQRELLRDLSHEIRTPLARLQVAAERVELDASDAIATEQIQHQVQEINRLVEDMLYLSRNESASAEALTPWCAPSALQRARARACLSAQEKSLAVELVVSQDLPPVQASTPLLDRVLDNLLNNAIRHSPAGGTVTLSAQTKDNAVAVSVSDEGPGVPPAALER
ncbi:MAG: HAMP domain-containing sensor histidine kinase, partial [Pseudomonadota bacterium]